MTAHASGAAPDDGLPGRGRVVKSADRAIDILEALGTGAEMTLAELAQRLSIPKSSLHGLLGTLHARQWIQTDKSGQRFRMGLRAVFAGSALVERDEVVAEAGPLMDWLAEETGETVQLARLDHGDVVYLAKRQSPHPVSLVSSVGSRLPAHATALGKALLSHRTIEEVERNLSFPLRAVTAQTLRTREQLVEELSRARRQGYAIDEEEVANGVYCFATVLPWSQPPMDAISVSVPSFRATKEVLAEIVALLLEVRHRAGAGPTGA